MSKKRRMFRKPIGYDAIAEEYEKVYGNNPHQVKAIEWLSSVLPLEASILDVGSGTGIPTAKILSEKGFNVTGIDNSTRMIQIARKKVPKARFIEMNIKRLRLDVLKFDAITAFFSLLHVQEEIFDRVVANLLRHLKEGGYFVLSMVEGNSNAEGRILGQKMWFVSFPKEELEQRVMKAGLTILESRRVRFQPKKENFEPEDQIFLYCRKS